MTPFRRVLVLLAVLASSACSGDDPTTPVTPPAITITGVEDGAVLSGPVTIGIAVDRGSYTATLDGAVFHSGTTVTQAGDHVLFVTARDGTVTSELEVNFTIQGAAGSVLLVRMINLGSNGSGGGGDAILITDSSSSGMVHALIDAGPGGSNASDPGLVARRLAALGVDRLSFMLLTHAHSDHFQGMPDVLEDIPVARFYYSGQVRNLSFYQSLLSLARAEADTVIIVSDTIAFALGSAQTPGRFTLIPALPTYLNDGNADADEMNEGSVGAALRRNGFEMFFTGDGEVEANRRWRTQFAAYTADLDVLKVGHHGANNAIFDNGFNGESTWLTHTTPEVSIISANGVTHPRHNALNRLLAQSNARTYCTNVHGDIVIRVLSDGSYTVITERNADSVCVAGSTATS